MKIELHALVPDPVLPITAPASTRANVPRGYGVQEQCLPFTAATSAGLLIRSPFSFGYCAPVAVPVGARAFPPPFRSDANPSHVFYVEDRPSSDFIGNAVRAAPIAYLDPSGKRHTHNAIHAGLSVFDRDDQAGLFKLNLPYVLRTPEGVDSLFMTPVNRAAPLQILMGLVETDWYASPVNLVAHLPTGSPLHVAAGDVVGQVVFMHRAARSAEVSIVAPGTAASQAFQHELLRWYIGHNQDRSVYKKLARSRHGRLEPRDDGSEDLGKSPP